MEPKDIIDHRALNYKTSSDKYPLPRIDDVLNQLVKVNCFSSIDLHTGYYYFAIRQGMSIKQLSYLSMACLAFLCCHLAKKMLSLHFRDK